MAETPTLLIVYYSYTGGTAQMAQAAYEAARAEQGCQTVMKRAEDAAPEDLLAAEGYVFAAPENLAAIAGVMKAFYDRSYYEVLGRIEGRPYAQMICAGSDGDNAVKQTARIAKGWRLKAVADPIIICTHADSQKKILAEKTIDDERLKDCADLGRSLAAGLAMGIF